MKKIVLTNTLESKKPISSNGEDFHVISPSNSDIYYKINLKNGVVLASGVSSKKGVQLNNKFWLPRGEYNITTMDSLSEQFSKMTGGIQ